MSPRSISDLVVRQPPVLAEDATVGAAVEKILEAAEKSGANAIHGIILVGALIVTAHATNMGILILGLVAVVLSSMNLIGGFVVTDRMLEMFSGKKKEAAK